MRGSWVRSGTAGRLPRRSGYTSVGSSSPRTRLGPPNPEPGLTGRGFLLTEISSLGDEARPLAVGDLTLMGLLQPPLTGLRVDGALGGHPGVAVGCRREHGVHVAPERSL